MWAKASNGAGAGMDLRVKVRVVSAGRLLVAGFALMCGWPAEGQSAVQNGNEAGRFVVVVDAAHGGDDSGAQLAGSVAERTVTLAMNVRLRSLLSARGVRVVTTREENVNMDGDARAQVANHAGAAACISIHATEAGAGVHLFVSSLAAGAAGGGPVRFLAWKTAQAGFVTRSLRLASVVNSALEHSSGLDAGSGSEAGNVAIPVTVARTPLPGVDSMACPAVAIEVAPLRGADHRVLTEVTDARYQAQITAVLAAALLEWRTDGETGAERGAGQP